MPQHIDSDPLNVHVAVAREWSTTNFSEAMPGVPTPLSWSVWHRGLDRGSQRSFVQLGALPRLYLAEDLPYHLRITGIFYGRVAGNVSLFHQVTAAMPGTSPAVLDEQVFGMVRPETDSTPRYRRYPIVAVRAPLTLARLPRRLRAIRTEAGQTWRTETSRPIHDEVAGRRVLALGADLFERALGPHSLVAMLAPAAFHQLAGLTAAAGTPGLERRLVTGAESMEEVKVADDLWAAARGTTTIEDVLAAHGFHGPAEGELSSRSWREDHGPLLRAFAAYEQMPDEDAPAAKRRRLASTRSDAEHVLMSGLGRLGQARARAVIRLARRFLADREVGKTAFVQALDVARHGARGLGQVLAMKDVLAAPDDIFYFTLDELASGDLPREAKQIVLERRDTRESYARTRVPDVWTGQPPRLSDEHTDDHSGSDNGADEVITGLAAASGTVEGIAKVILDPAASQPLEPDEILVCATTDPSWVAVMVCAGGLVIDIGGLVSHGAIIAREMGVPCVINTKIGTTRIHTGDRLRVDGDNGTVQILKPAKC